MTGKDVYASGHGRMIGKLAGVITVADDKGEMSDIGGGADKAVSDMAGL